MDIRFVSSLTAEDENVFAPAVLRAAIALLDQFPIAYTLRIETAGTQVYHHTHPSIDGEGAKGSLAEAVVADRQAKVSMAGD